MYDDGEEKLKNDFEKPKFTPYDDSYGTMRERGGCLSVFLVFIMAVNVFALFLYCNQISELSRYSGSSSLMPLLAVAFGVQCVVIACAVAVWNWKKWGYYGLMVSYVLSIVLSLVTGALTNIIGAFIGMGILFALVNDKLDMFD